MSAPYNHADTTKRPLPPGWRWVRLADLIVSLESGSRPKGGVVGINSGVPSISGENMLPNGTFDFSCLRYVPLEYYETMRRGRIRRGDILIVKDGATTGKTCFVDDTFPFDAAVVNEHVFICRVDNSEIIPELLFRWLCGTEGRSAILANFQGAAIGGINQSFKQRIFVPVPCLSEQERIIAVLREQMVAVERARRAAEEQREAVKGLPAAFIRSVFSNKEAQRWQKIRLGDICDILPARSITSSGDCEVLAITTACLTETGFDPSGIKPARMWRRDVTECVVKDGEILIARSNTPELVGRVAMFAGQPKGVIASDLTIRVRVKDGIDPKFLEVYLRYLYLTGCWERRAGGASGSMKKITRRQIQNEHVPLPAVSTQYRIASELSKQMAAAERARKAIEEQLEAINKLPAAILRKEFNGEL